MYYNINFDTMHIQLISTTHCHINIMIHCINNPLPFPVMGGFSNLHLCIMYYVYMYAYKVVKTMPCLPPMTGVYTTYTDGNHLLGMSQLVRNLLKCLNMIV